MKLFAEIVKSLYRVASDTGIYWGYWDILGKISVLGLCLDSQVFRGHTGRCWDFLKVITIMGSQIAFITIWSKLFVNVMYCFDNIF